jgi:hypothetical protein
MKSTTGVIDQSNPVAVLSNAESTLTTFFESIQHALDARGGKDKDAFLIAGTGILRARMTIRESLFTVRRHRAERRWRPRVR